MSVLTAADYRLVRDLVSALTPAPAPAPPRLRGCVLCGFPTRSVLCVAHSDLIQDPDFQTARDDESSDGISVAAGREVT